MKLCFATNNPHKLHEIRALLGRDFELLSLADTGCDEDLPETRETLEGNALQKAQYVYEHYHVNCFADDTGLEVDALDGAPGVFSARYAGPQRSDSDNIERLLGELKPATARKARFRTVIALIINGAPKTFEGVVNGVISEQIRGKEGFGYDPVFIPDGYTQTFAEIGSHEKNKISHRAIAVNKLLDYLVHGRT